MKIEPLDGKVVVKRLDAESTTRGGIVLPATAQEKPRQARVLSVGDGRLLANGQRVPHQVSEGDRVLFLDYAGTDVVINDQTLLILGEDEILAVLE